MLVPAATPVASPPAVIVATAGVADAHVTWRRQVLRAVVAERSGRRELLRRPLAIDGFAGVTAIDCSVAAVTVSTVDPLTPPSVALIVLVPGRHARRQTRPP